MNISNIFQKHVQNSILTKRCMLNMKSRIELQYSICFNEFCCKLKENNAIIAGSFVLSCLLDEEYSGSDIDIYLKQTTDNCENSCYPVQPFESWLYELYISDKDSNFACYAAQYSFLEEIEYVRDFGTSLTDKSIQIITLKCDPIDFISNQFDLSFCKLYFDGYTVKHAKNYDISRLLLKVGYLENYSSHCMKIGYYWYDADIRDTKQMFDIIKSAWIANNENLEDIERCKNVFDSVAHDIHSRFNGTPKDINKSIKQKLNFLRLTTKQNIFPTDINNNYDIGTRQDLGNDFGHTESCILFMKCMKTIERIKKYQDRGFTIVGINKLYE